jgi:hypothetical protein
VPKIKLSPSILQKNYLKSLNKYHFDSLLHLCLMLFSTHIKGTQDLEEIYQLLDEIGYQNLKDIPADEMDAIAAYVELVLPDWKREQDPERRTYLLLAAIQRHDIVVLIDDDVVSEVQAEVLLEPDSVISFIDKNKLSRITFTTL